MNPNYQSKLLFYLGFYGDILALDQLGTLFKSANDYNFIFTNLSLSSVLYLLPALTYCKLTLGTVFPHLVRRDGD